MVTATRASLPRSAAVWVAATTGGAGVTAVALPALPATLGASTGARPDQALVGLCAGVAVLAAGWLWLVTTVVVVAALRGRVGEIRGVPAPVRRVLLAGCGVAVLGGLALPAGATPGAPHEDRVAPAPTLAGLPYPDRAVSSASHDPSRPGHPGRTVVVRPGDCLWSIAARDLGPTATDAEVARRTDAIHRLNRAVIGPDPDLIQPAQRLRLPGPPVRR